MTRRKKPIPKQFRRFIRRRQVARKPARRFIPIRRQPIQRDPADFSFISEEIDKRPAESISESIRQGQRFIAD